ncbi:MAG: cation:proton antiporter [Candidatus Micrarchaeales archaeon]|nr:cation:proton antiporter [Candidatus Micrarchaeales archaeon]
MSEVAFVFIFFAVIAFLGFIINAMFYKFKISNILPLMLIGVLVGPVLNLIYTGPGSLASFLTPYISAIAIAFVLFDVGINMEASKLKAIFARATAFTLLLETATGIGAAIFAYYFFGWTLIEAFIFGFAVAGPSSISVPTLMGVIKAKVDLRTALIYESVASDMMQLIIPLVLIGLVLNPVTTLSGVAYFTFTVIIGSLLLAVISALFWLYVLNKYRDQSKSYSWMLTVTMIIATYGIADALGLESAITVFVFGLAFATIGGVEAVKKGSILSADIFKKFAASRGVKHIRSYQREIVFFASTFFFVYIGMLLNLSGVTLYLVAAAIAITIGMLLLRVLFSPLLAKYYSDDKKMRKTERELVFFDVARGLSPIIIAVVVLTSNISMPGLVTAIFMVVLFTNIVSTIGIWAAYRHVDGLNKPDSNGQEKLKPAKE